jgi:hypothetical protein
MIGGSRRAPSLTVFSFHAIVDEPLSVPDWCFLDRRVFAAQLERISRGFEVVSLARGLAALRAGTLARASAALTFDDGLQSHHDSVLPFLQRAGLPATYFINTQAVATQRPLWFCRLHRALSLTRRREVRFGRRRW